MLIFTRHVQQVVTIGDNIRVRVLEIKGNQVRLGITAPRKIAVHREEVYDRINQGTKRLEQPKAGQLIDAAEGAEPPPVKMSRARPLTATPAT